VTAHTRESGYIAGSFLTTHNISLSGTPAAGATLVYYHHTSATGAYITGITGFGATWENITPAGGGLSISPYGQVEVWIGKQCSGAGGTLDVTFDSNRAMVANIVEWPDLVGVRGVAATATGTGTTAEAGTVTPAVGDVVLSVMGDRPSGTVTGTDTPAAFTALTQRTTGNYRANGAYRTATTADAHRRVFTRGASYSWAAINVVLETRQTDITPEPAEATADAIPPIVGVGISKFNPQHALASVPMTQRLVDGLTVGTRVVTGTPQIVSSRFASSSAGTECMAAWAPPVYAASSALKISGKIKVDKTAGRSSFIGLSTATEGAITTTSNTAEIGHLAGTGFVLRSTGAQFTQVGLCAEAGLTDGDEYLVTLCYTGTQFSDAAGSGTGDGRWCGWMTKVDGTQAPYTAGDSVPADRVWVAATVTALARTNSALGTIRDVIFAPNMFAVNPGFGQLRSFPYYGTAGERMGIWTKGLSTPIRLVVFIGGTTSYGGYANLMGYPIAGSPRDDYRSTIHDLVEAGYTVITPNALHEGWGADDAQASVVEAVDDFVAAAGVTDHRIFYLSYSMGGTAAWRALHGANGHPRVVAAYFIASVADLNDFSGNIYFQDHWGTDPAGWDNPVDWTKESLLLGGTRTRHTTGTSDVTVPTAGHTDVMSAIYDGHPMFEANPVSGADHYSALLWDGPDVVAFYDDADANWVQYLGNYFHLEAGNWVQLPQKRVVGGAWSDWNP